MHEDWIGLIPAAGKGLRLGLPYPKELYPIIHNNKYKPVSQFIVEQMLNVGVSHIVFVINETKHQLLEYFGNGSKFNCNFSYVVQERNKDDAVSTSPGLANALDSAYHLTRNKIVFFGMPDTIIRPLNSYSLGIDKLSTYDVLLYLFPTQTPIKFGMVKFTDDLVEEIIDKPDFTDLLYMWGAIVWKPVFTEFLHKKVSDEGITDFAKIMNDAIRAEISFGCTVISSGTFMDIGTYDEISELENLIKKFGD
jgi:glucose-1-phosphate thymidylyltransferase